MTERKDTKLAVTRRETKAIKDAGRAAPISYVTPPIAQVLGTIQAVAGNEVRAMLKHQELHPDSRLDTDDAKKLNALTDAIVKAHGAERDLGEQELGEKSDEELEQELVEELERIRARKKP